MRKREFRGYSGPARVASTSDGLETYLAWFWAKHALYSLDAARFQDFNERSISEAAAGKEGFTEGRRRLALESLGDPDRNQLRKALSALAVVGQPEDISSIELLREHGDEQVRRDVGTCVYLIGRKRT